MICRLRSTSCAGGNFTKEVAAMLNPPFGKPEYSRVEQEHRSTLDPKILYLSRNLASDLPVHIDDEFSGPVPEPGQSTSPCQNNIDRRVAKPADLLANRGTVDA